MTSLPFSEILPSLKSIYLKGLAALSMLTTHFLEVSNPISSKLIGAFMERLEMVVDSFVASPNNPQLTKRCQDVVINTYSTFMSESMRLNDIVLRCPVLISPGVAKFLKTSSSNSQIDTVLKMLIAVATKVRKFYKKLESQDQLSMTIEGNLL